MNTTAQPGSTLRKIPNVPMGESFLFLLRHKTLLIWSTFLVLLTIFLTWAGFLLTTDLIDNLTGSFFSSAPAHESLLGWIKYGGWQSARYLFLFVSRIVSFFLAFLLAYSLTTPFYGFLSAATEKLSADRPTTIDASFTILGIIADILEGLKIALFGLFVTCAALILSFIPILGQLAVFLMYSFYSTLMFIDYPASRRRWPLGEKLSWIRSHPGPSFQMGFIPALVSMIPILNIFFMALIFPLFTIHATLNFLAIEKISSTQPSDTGQEDRTN